MLRRQARMRREYLYRKAKEGNRRALQDRKDRLRKSLKDNIPLDGDLKVTAVDLQKKLQWEDEGPRRSVAMGTEMGGGGGSHEDDEYQWAGVEDPKVIITTCREPSSRLKMFVKEVRLVIPNSQRINRGNYDMKQLVQACQANQVTDLVLLHEHRGVPDGLVVCHLPYGPTAYFTLRDVIMRHDVPGLGTVSEQFPHLIFHNLRSSLGLRVVAILKHLFPVPKEDSKRVITFANHDDHISFRQHMYRRGKGGQVELSEVGPRFQLKLYEIKLGTLEHADAADSEWSLRPYMNTSAKRRFLSNEDGWDQNDDVEVFPDQ